MTHMYYHDEELGPREYDGAGELEIDGFPVSEKKSHLRLHEIEEQLQMAETRCNTLKGHLEHMKNVYHKSSAESPRKGKGSSTPTQYIESVYNEEGVNQKASVASTPSLEPSRDQPSNQQPVRQSSHVISTDTTGAAVLTINHILTGITESVNRLSQLHSHLGTNDRKYSPRARTFSTIQSNNPYGERVGGPPKMEEVQIPERLTNDSTEMRNVQTLSQQQSKDKESSCSIIEELSTKDPAVKIRSKSNLKRKNRHTRHLNQTTPSTPAKRSNIVGKNAEKKSLISPARTNTGLVKSTSTVCYSKKRKLKRLQQSVAKTGPEKARQVRSMPNEKLIELYHNVAIKESDSGESNTANPAKSTTFAKALSQKNVASTDSMVPPLRISSSMKREIANTTRKAVSENAKDAANLTPIEEIDYTEPAAPRGFVSNLCTTFERNYQLPTIASRLKQVAKSYLNSFNFRAIPFCAAKSITPSHNIGINIQQVMSIIKTRHPIHGLSPTLAHNIGLAADKLNSKPLHALMSSLSSRVGYPRNCPLTRSMFKYPTLQEMAKNIPDENLIGLELSPDGNVQSRGVDPMQPSDATSPNKNATADKTRMIWSRVSSGRPQCTCLPADGDSFQHVYSKYGKYGFGTPASQMQHPTPMSQQSVPKYAVLKPRSSKTIARRIRGKPATPKQREPSVMEKRQKSLKEVLQNLHDDFDSLNNKYEELRKLCGTSDEPNHDMTKELEKMEAELNNKEEEINMVLTLYKEISALKEQVKILKKKASTTTVSNPKIAAKTCNEPQTAIHLSKLLREVQNFQQHYKVKQSKK